MRVYYEVCTDCLMFAVNGDLPEDDARAAEVVAGFESDRVEGHLVQSGNGYSTFSWQSCDACGTGLGGERHEMEAII